MANAELGTKRVCPVTGRKFYDLNKSPIISPYTGQVVTIAAPVLRGMRAEPAARVVEAAAVEADPDIEAAEDAELVSLEEADEDGTTTAMVVTTADDIEIDDEAEADDGDTFLVPDEDEGDDVTDLIGDGIEDEEER